MLDARTSAIGTSPVAIVKFVATARLWMGRSHRLACNVGLGKGVGLERGIGPEKGVWLGRRVRLGSGVIGLERGVGLVPEAAANTAGHGQLC
jgi:hypothetical protein